jgi:uncharacterized protein (DUF2235 family)
MRRLLIFCDGTWNKETTDSPTNVVLAAQAVKPVGDDGVDQIVYYSEGVGTSWLINQRLETVAAGAFGWGLFDRIAEAYRFLVFNYTPGDEIYIFGFSRGAFTARSLGGLIRKCGIIPKSRTHAIAEAYAFYRREDVKPDDGPAQQFRAQNSSDTIMKDLGRTWRAENGYLVRDLPNFTIRYIGVWDTVGELGIPKYLLISEATNAKYAFHDLKLSSTVEAARQALAVDENRLEFEPTEWAICPISTPCDPAITGSSGSPAITARSAAAATFVDYPTTRSPGSSKALWHRGPISTPRCWRTGKPSPIRWRRSTTPASRSISPIAISSARPAQRPGRSRRARPGDPEAVGV